jgi:sulfite reductase (NADPH) flavoprotein alpha-component
MQLPASAPFDDQQKAALATLLRSMTHEQAHWLTGFIAGLETAAASHQSSLLSGRPSLTIDSPQPSPQIAATSVQATTPIPAPAPVPITPPIPQAKLPLTILYGSESGNAEGLAMEAKKAASARGLLPSVKSMADVSPADLIGIKHLLVIVSTWGDGDPPESALDFHAALMAEDAPRLDGLSFSVCALGDTAYEKFCECGIQVDARLDQLGATRMLPRQDCDVDFEAPYGTWIGLALTELEKAAASESVTSSSPQVVTPPLTASTSPVGPLDAPTPTYDKRKPFPTPLLERVLLSGEHSRKETIHLEFSLEGSGLSYEPGDALAIIPQNAPDGVAEVLHAAHLAPQADSMVTLKDGASLSLREALLTLLDCTTLSKKLVQDYARSTGQPGLRPLLAETEESAALLRSYLDGRQLIDLLTDFPASLEPQQFVDLLRKLPPRLYSIASSPLVHPGQVHLTVAAVRYESHGRKRKGVASTYLADLTQPGETTPAYTVPNKHFKLPADPSTPIIMVGPGTGVAPFRAFIEHRSLAETPGASWLFFGDWTFQDDFLYQLEWQEHLKSGTLSRLDVAFSRDQPNKVYVQHRIRERGADLFRWLEDGAHLYICGDATRMAPDVHAALVDVVSRESGSSQEAAEEYFQALRKAGRYQKDVY